MFHSTSVVPAGGENRLSAGLMALDKVAAAGRMISAIRNAVSQWLFGAVEDDDPVASAESGLALYGRWSAIHDCHPTSGKRAR